MRSCRASLRAQTREVRLAPDVLRAALRLPPPPRLTPCTHCIVMARACARPALGTPRRLGPLSGRVGLVALAGLWSLGLVGSRSRGCRVRFRDSRASRAGHLLRSRLSTVLLCVATVRRRVLSCVYNRLRSSCCVWFRILGLALFACPVVAAVS